MRFNGRRELVVCVMLLNASGAAQRPDAVFDRLANVDLFAFGGVGFAGSTSQGERDFNLVLSRSSAPADFERLFHTGNIQAKAYALVALHRLEPVKFQSLATPLRSAQDKVSTMQGCVMWQQTIADVLTGIEHGRYSLWVTRAKI